MAYKHRKENGNTNGGSVVEKAQEVVKTAEVRLDQEITFRQHALKGVDTMWLLLLRATAFNPVCTSTYTFDRELDVGKLREALQRQSELFPKYRQRLTLPTEKFFHGPYFENDPDFSVDRHLSVVDLPEPCGPKELDAFVSHWISKGWDEKLPLWEVAYIRKYSDGGPAKAAMVSRGHHTQADGQGFIMSALYVTSYGEELHKMMEEGRVQLRQARLGQLPPADVSPFQRHLTGAWETPSLRPFVSAYLFLVYWIVALLDAIERVVWSAVHILYGLWFFLITFWRIEMIVPVKGGKRGAVFALSKPLKLRDVKTIQHAFSGSEPGPSQRGWMGHVTVNDVLCSMLSDVISAGIERRRQKVPSSAFARAIEKVIPAPIAFFIPISVRAPGQWDMRNLSTGAIAYMSHLPDVNPSTERIHKHIHKCKRSLKVLKRSYLGVWAFHVLQVVGQVPVVFYPIWGGGIWQSRFMVWLKDAFWGAIISYMSAIVTNIPGPPAEAKLEGSRILNWTALPPQGGRGTLGIGIITYNDMVYITASIDKVPGFEDAAEQICEDFEKRFKLYLRAAEQALDE